MKKIALSLLMLLALSFTACENEKTEVEILQDKFDKNMKETIAVHDEVMPKMGEINKLLADLEIQSPKMEQKEYQSASNQLQDAYMEMMAWMKNLSSNFDTKEVNSGITSEDIAELKAKNKLLEEVKASAKSMRNNILSSLKNGQMLYEKYE